MFSIFDFFGVFFFTFFSEGDEFGLCYWLLVYFFYYYSVVLAADMFFCLDVCLTLYF